MSNTNRLALSVTHSDGRVTRWGPGEPDATDIPGDLTFSTQIPGGFKDLSCSLLRRIDIDYPDMSLFDHVRVYGPGNRTVWEGRMAQFPRSHGDGFQIVPGAVGHSAALTDNPSFSEIYVDRDPSHWGDIPLTEKLRLATGGFDGNGAMSFAISDGALVCSIPNQAFPAAAQAAAAWYIGPAGSVIAKIMYVGSVTSLPAGWTHAMYFSASDSLVTFTGVTPTLDGTLRTATPSPTRNQYAAIHLTSAGTSLTPAAGAQVRYSKLGVYGNSGITTHAISGEPDGVYASDVIADIVTRTAPSLNLGDIEATTFPIPHLVFLDPVTGESAVQLTNGYHGFDWGVYDNREFFYRSSDPDRLTWQARLSTGARLDLEGDTAEQIFNGVYVTYQDPSGARKTVGPPGASADATDSQLVDTDPTNPVNAWSLTRWGMLEISQVTTLAGATQLGAIWLAEHSAPQRRGTLTLTGSVTHPTIGEVPVSWVRAGDYISIVDHPADVPRKIIETNYTHGQRQLVCNLDNTPYLLDALLQRFGAGLVGVL